MENVRCVVAAWLQAKHALYDLQAGTEQYVLGTFYLPVEGNGSIELIDDPELSQSGGQLVLALVLDLPPMQTVADAEALLSLADWLTGVTLVSKDFGSGGKLSLQAKIPLDAITHEALDMLLLHVTEARNWFCM